MNQNKNSTNRAKVIFKLFFDKCKFPRTIYFLNKASDSFKIQIVTIF